MTTSYNVAMSDNSTLQRQGDVIDHIALVQLQDHASTFWQLDHVPTGRRIAALGEDYAAASALRTELALITDWGAIYQPADLTPDDRQKIRTAIQKHWR